MNWTAPPGDDERDADDESPSLAGVDVPDRRGRTGLHLTGRDLRGNPAIRIVDVELLASDWYVLRATTFRRRTADGSWVTERRETYDRGDGATLLLYDLARSRVLLTRQFRLPAYVNGHPDGMLVESPAGLLDEDDPLDAVRREVSEETGIDVGEVEHVFDLYMSPGSVTEKLHFYAGPYEGREVDHQRHGVAEEGEDIELVELPVADAVAGIGTSIVDAKTVLLLQWAITSGPFAPVRC